MANRTALVITALITAVVVGVVGWSVGRLGMLPDPDPSTTSAEAGFARDMQVHHNQGVELAMIVRDRTDDPDVRRLAYDIAITQGQQSGQLHGWLSAWGLPQAGSEPAMTWMARPGAGATVHGHGGASAPPQPTGSMPEMPGMATPAQVAALTAASGVEAERLFLTLMIAHHRGALQMAEAVLERTDNTMVRTFATAVVASQQSEIEQMQRMLAQRS